MIENNYPNSKLVMGMIYGQDLNLYRRNKINDNSK